MPWWRESDTFADDPRWMLLAGNNADRADRLQAAYCRLKSKASHQKHNGYLTHHMALETCHRRTWTLDRLCTAVLDLPPMLHRKGDECDCLDDAWVAGFDFRLHGFLYTNPSRAEYERNQAQRADRADARLRELVKRRDASCCRYCRSGPLSSKAGRSRDRRKVLVLDHVDPDQPAGPDGENYVVACGACNEWKGKRTPDEADMVLLPEPTELERAEWSARDRLLLDRPRYVPNGPADHRANNAGSTSQSTTEQTTDQNTEQRSGVVPNTDPIGDPNTDRGADSNTDPRPPVRPEHGQHPPDQRETAGGDPLGTGRVGQPHRADAPPRASPALPVRTARHPDPYTRRSRAGPAPPPIPDEQWPPGSTHHRPALPEVDP